MNADREFDGLGAWFKSAYTSQDHFKPQQDVKKPPPKNVLMGPGMADPWNNDRRG